MRYLLLLFLAGLGLGPAAAQSWTVTSPNGRLALTVAAGERLTYAIHYDGRPVVAPSAISLTVDSTRVLGAAPRLRRSQAREGRDTLTAPVPYKRRRLPDHYRELTLWFRGDYGLVLRAADDGVAYRFFTELPGALRVDAEEMTVTLAAADSVYLPLMNCAWPRQQGYDCFHTPFEEVYRVLAAGDLRDTLLAFLPVLAARPDGVKVVLTEADLDDYPGMFVTGRADGAGLQGRFAPYPLEERPSADYYTQPLVTRRAPYLAMTRGTRTFPWRVFVVSDRDGDLIESDLVYRLGGEPELTDVSWFQPGKSQSEWVVDNNLYGVDFRAGYNTETYRYYIDYAAEFDLGYVMFDAGWSDVGDLFRITPEMDMPWLIAYAREKGVRVVLWTNTVTLERQLEAALDTFQRWGVSGIMVDFMNRDDQRMVNFYRRVAEETAKRRIFVDFHGSYKPTGLERRFPHLVTREGVVAFEWDKWSDIVTPEYEVTVPFIRMVAGPLDYEPGTMRNATRETFRAIGSVPMAQGTRVHQLAMFVVYESPFAKIAANPADAYREPDFTRFMAAIPTVWEETRVLDARLADYVLLWRRAANGDHYVAAMGDWSPRDLSVDFSFLPPGTYELHVCEDGVNADRYAADYRFRTLTVRAGERLPIRLAPGGGWVGRLRRVGE